MRFSSCPGILLVVAQQIPNIDLVTAIPGIRHWDKATIMELMHASKSIQCNLNKIGPLL